MPSSLFRRSAPWLLFCAIAFVPFVADAQSEMPHFRFGTMGAGLQPGGGGTPPPEPPPAEEAPTTPSLDVSGVPTSGRVDEPYFGTALLGGSATTLTVTNTPHGVRSLGQTLSGYPTDEGLYTVNFVARADDGQTASASVPVTIDAIDFFKLDLSGLPRTGRVGDYYDGMAISEGGSLPEFQVIGPTLGQMGLSMDSRPTRGYGRIEGVLAAEGEFDLLVEVRSADGAIRTGVRTVTVFPAEPDPLHPGLPDSGPYVFASDRARVGQQIRDPEGDEGYAYVWITNWNNGDSLAFSVASGSLPTGVTLGAWGDFEGVVTQEGDFTFTVRAEVRTGGVVVASGVTAPFTISVGPALPSAMKAWISTNDAQKYWQGSAMLTSAQIGYYDGAAPYTHEPIEVFSQSGSVTFSNTVSGHVNQIVANWTSPGEAVVRGCASDTAGVRICRSVRLASTYTGFDASLSFPNRNLTCSVASGNRAPFSYDVLVNRAAGHTAPITVETELTSRELAPFQTSDVSVSQISGGYRVSGMLDTFNETVSVRSVIRDSLGSEIVRLDNVGFTVALGDCDVDVVLGGAFTVQWNTLMTIRNVGLESQYVGVSIRNAWGRVEWIAQSHVSNCQVPEYMALSSNKQAWQTRQIWLIGQGRCGHFSSESRTAAQTYFFRDSLGRVRETNVLYIYFPTN